MHQEKIVFLAIQIETRKISSSFFANLQISWASSSFQLCKGHRSRQILSFNMESRYGIGINNRYALFLEGEDGEDLIVPKKKTSDTKAPVIDAKPAAPAVKKADSLDSKKDKTTNQTNRVTKDNKPNNREGIPSVQVDFLVKSSQDCQRVLGFNEALVLHLWYSIQVSR